MDQNSTLAVSAAGVLTNDFDSDEDTLTAILQSGPVNGYLNYLSFDGSFEYVPSPGFSGSDSFTYVAHDGLDDSNLATVHITVELANEIPTVSVSQVQNASEGGTDGYVRLTRTGSTDGTLTIDIELDASTSAVEGTDFTTIARTATFSIGQSVVDIPIHAIDDSEVDPDEYFGIYLMDMNGSFISGSPGSATVTIADNDVAAVVTVSSVQDAYEGGSNGFFRLSRTVADSALTVSFVVDEYYTTARNGIDIQYLAGTDASDSYCGEITFASGAFDVDIVVVPINDNFTEGDETIQISLVGDTQYAAYTGNATAAYTLGASYSGTVTVYDDEDSNATPVVTIDSTRDASESGQRGYFRLRPGRIKPTRTLKARSLPQRTRGTAKLQTHRTRTTERFRRYPPRGQ